LLMIAGYGVVAVFERLTSRAKLTA
jgi:hypothetical protein